MTAGWSRWMRIFRRDPQADVDAELRFHMDARVEDLIARGMSAESARAQALAEFGDVEATRARLGAIDQRIAARHQRADWWEGIAQDLRHTLRGLARSPGFTVMVVVTLALGIGANAAVFSVLDRLFLQLPPGVTTASQTRSVAIRYHQRRTGAPATMGVLSFPTYQSIVEAAPDMPIAGFSIEQTHFGSGPGAPQVNVEMVMGDYFGVLGVRAARGRTFRPDELALDPKAPVPVPVAVISDAMWRERFGGDSAILGKPLFLGVHQFTIVGVAPPNFRGTELDAIDLWVPLNTEGSWKPGKTFHLFTSDRTGFIQTIARVADAQAAARLISLATPAVRTGLIPGDTLATAVLEPLNGAGTAYFGQQEQVATRLAGVAAIILLLACANVANLLLTRGMRRRREIAIRLALGVSRRRLVAQLMAESAVLAIAAAVVALLVGLWSAGALRHALLPDIRWAGPAMNAHVAVFTGLVAALTALMAGLIPALQSASPNINASLKAGGLDAAGARSRTRATLIVLQATLSVVLLAGAGLFVRSLRAVQGIDVGYDTQLTILASANYDTDAQPVGGATRSAQLVQVAEALRQSRNIAAVGTAANAPMQAISFESMFLPDRDSVPTLNGTPPLIQFVSPGFFKASGIRLLAGRPFADDDRVGAEPVVVVSESMARTFWPNETALGKCVILDKRSEPCRRVVGVVTDEHVVGIVEATMMHVFVPLAQWPSIHGPGEIVIGAAPGRVDAAAADARRELVRVFGPQAIPTVRVMRDVLAPQMRQWRLGALLFSAAGLLALVVAAVGVYSAMSYGVSLRRREIGIRMALGAGRGGIVGLIMTQGVRTVAIGIALGVLASLAMGRLVASLLYGVTPHDPVVLSATAAVLLAVAALACLIPARRAARVDPMETLRAE